MTYAETLAYLYARLPMFQRIGAAAYKADLATTHALMDMLGHPEHGLRCVHVAGTNGKGSTCSLIASALQAAGYKVGLHTSPHLKDFRERFRINGAMVREEVIVRFVEEHRTGFEPLAPSFFEWGVAFALWWFREEQVDIAVIETGMGGRLDSTNVVSPEVSVITTIGWDHMQFLGETLPAIAAEKAGIIKSGVPVVIGNLHADARAVVEHAAHAQGSPVLHAMEQAHPLPPSDLDADYQADNKRTALSALHALRERGWRVNDASIATGFLHAARDTGLRGRWETLSASPRTIADVAHNADGVMAMKRMLERTPHHRLHVVLGMVSDKDISRVLDLLPKRATYYFCKADIPRGLNVEALAAKAGAAGLIGTPHPSVQAALHAARTAAAPEDLVLVTGSVFVVAEAI